MESSTGNSILNTKTISLLTAIDQTNIVRHSPDSPLAEKIKERNSLESSKLSYGLGNSRDGKKTSESESKTEFAANENVAWDKTEGTSKPNNESSQEAAIEQASEAVEQFAQKEIREDKNKKDEKAPGADLATADDDEPSSIWKKLFSISKECS